MTSAESVQHGLSDEAEGEAALGHFRTVRAATNQLIANLSPEDCQIQSMPDASPAKWHLAHTTWFFETFLLTPLLAGYRSPDPAYSVLFNSYYVSVGDRHPRPQRGMLSRPSFDAVMAYRAHVDAAMGSLLITVPEPAWRDLVTLGLHHEQQHQELLLMDIQHAFSANPMEPAHGWTHSQGDVVAAEWIALPGGLHAIGYDGTGFAFDNERPRHRVWLEPFEIARGLVTCGEFAEFIEDGGYLRPELWLSDGWEAVTSHGWLAPLYWRADGDGWSRFGLQGRHPVHDCDPALHVSYYEADAFARWAGARLPTEAEWEVAAIHGLLYQVDDAGWQWTASDYAAYPGFVAEAGAVGEYNGKFMVNQQVLRGGSLATPAGHSRPTYRNCPPSAPMAQI
jgi:ergothioneine biosynthesis protein EgtB